MATRPRQDDFDMTKLRKSLKQQKRRSLSMRESVTKLSPAEIRSLNNSIAASKANSINNGSGTSPSSSNHHLSSNTPPLTPDYQSSQTSQQSGKLGVDLPTPPHSPNHERRRLSVGSNTSSHIHAPRPQSYAQAGFIPSVAHSRPSSASSYRGLPTYRGPEITRTGSMTMIQRPSPQIVSNPLSNFSRPRQSAMANSPERKEERQNDGIDSTETDLKDGSQTFPVIGQSDSLEHGPVRPTESPVSEPEGEASTSLHPINTPNGPAGASEQNATHNEHAAEEDGAPVPAPSMKSKNTWRRNHSVASTDRDPSSPKKIERRRTLSFSKSPECLHAISYSETKQGDLPTLKDTLKGELPSSQSSIYKKDEGLPVASGVFVPHPAVRPLTVIIPTDTVDVKGKGRDLNSAPVYSRCDCCGKLRKPGFSSELSPVLENENLRSNFSMELERVDKDRRSSSVGSSTHRHRYVPIIPMDMGGNITRQATIEPPLLHEPAITFPVVGVSGTGDYIAPGSTPIAMRPKSQIDKAKLVRFKSLHFKGDDEKQDEDDVEDDQSRPQSVHRFASLYGLRPGSAYETNSEQEPSIEELASDMSQTDWPLKDTQYQSPERTVIPVSMTSSRGTEQYQYPSNANRKKDYQADPGFSFHHSTTLENAPQSPPKSATIVRIVPSAQVYTPMTSSPQIPANGPIRLGDWVLPESPISRQSPASSRPVSNRSNMLGGFETSTNGAHNGKGPALVAGVAN